MDYLLFLKKYALNYLSKYDSSRKNLEYILRKKISKLNIEKKEKFTLYNLIESILLEFESKKFINDKNYADRKIQNFFSIGKSKSFIKSYLFQKGIEKIIIIETINNFELNNPNWELESARIFARKRNLDTKNINNKKKDLAKMARAGFNYNIIKKLID